MANFNDDRGDRRDSRDSRSSGGGGFRGGSRRFGGSRSRGGFGGRDSSNFDRKPEMHDVTCDKCGKECQVPFKPSGDKPVLCSDCFRKNDSGRSFGRNGNRSSGGMSSVDLSNINTKLDKIMKALKIDSE